MGETAPSAREYGGKFGADAVQLDEPTHLFGARVARWLFSFDKLVAFRFDLPDMFGDHLEPLPLALDRDLQPRWNWPTIAGLHLIKALTRLITRRMDGVAGASAGRICQWAIRLMRQHEAEHAPQHQ